MNLRFLPRLPLFALVVAASPLEAQLPPADDPFTVGDMTSDDSGGPPTELPEPVPPPGAADEYAEAARRLQKLLARQEPYPALSQTALPAAPHDPEVDEAIRRYRETGDASILKRSDRVIYPYNQSQPGVRCSPLRACDVQLEPGEAITGVALGDSERWIASPMTSGDVESPTPHVILKPREYDVQTNLVIATNRRTYHLDLQSPTQREIENGEATYHRHVGFYYPEETVLRWAAAEELAIAREAAAGAARTETLTASGAIDLAGLNFAYTTRARRQATWTPSVVFDDGHHVYMKLPRHVVAGELPALLVETAGGELGVANYRVNDTWYVVDSLFRKAVLVRGVGKRRAQVEISNLRHPGS